MAEKRRKEVSTDLNKETTNSMPKALGIDSYGHEPVKKPETHDHEWTGVDSFEQKESFLNANWKKD